MLSNAITEEYAKADPVYVQKTMVRTQFALNYSMVPLTRSTQVLPQTYSHYRPIQGDGNCGWRGKSRYMSSTHTVFSACPPSNTNPGSNCLRLL